MDFEWMKTKVLKAGILMFIGAMTIVDVGVSTSYALMLDIRNGELFGAFDVNVNGTLYDVSFQDGTCIALYNGCDENTDFPFTNLSNLNDGALIGAAMRALLDQVFLDSPLGNFDSQPALTNGCFVAGGCQINTPLWVNTGSGAVGITLAFNHRNIIDAQVGSADHIGAGGGSRTFDTTHPFQQFDQNVYAVWSPSATPPPPNPAPVPEPSTLLLMGSGLAGLIGWQYRKKQST